MSYEVNQEAQSGAVEGIRHVPRPAGGGSDVIQVEESLAHRIMIGALRELKSEQVQEELLNGEVLARLKSERVQEMLKAMPAWKRRGNAIHRTRTFPNAELTALFCGLVTALSNVHSLPVGLQISGTRVEIRLHSSRLGGRIGPLSEEVVNLAAEIG